MTSKSDCPRSMLLKISQDLKSDMIVVGFHGRKGIKDDPTVMGSAI